MTLEVQQVSKNGEYLLLYNKEELRHDHLGGVKIPESFIPEASDQRGFWFLQYKMLSSYILMRNDWHR